MVGENWSYLWGVMHDYEADIIIGLLNEEGVPAIKHYPDAGAFLKIAYGLPTGVDLYVPTVLRQAALQLIEESLNIFLDKEDELEEETIKEAESVQHASDSASLQTSQVHLLVILLVVLVLISALVFRI